MSHKYFGVQCYNTPWVERVSVSPVVFLVKPFDHVDMARTLICALSYEYSIYIQLFVSSRCNSSTGLQTEKKAISLSIKAKKQTPKKNTDKRHMSGLLQRHCTYPRHRTSPAYTQNRKGLLGKNLTYQKEHSALTWIDCSSTAGLDELRSILSPIMVRTVRTSPRFRGPCSRQCEGCRPLTPQVEKLPQSPPCTVLES